MNIHQLTEITRAFSKEIETAASNKKTSLPFLIHQLALKPIINNNETFTVLRVGGSIYQKAVVEKKLSTLFIKSKQQAQLPQLNTATDFFKFIEKYFDPETNTIALNFAYPIQPIVRQGRLDGRLLSGTKEHGFKGLIGKNVGEEIEKYLYIKTGKQIQIAVANDTVCLLLSGLTKRKWDQISAGVVGTGLNFAIFLNEKTLVNLESAYFSKFTQSETGKKIDVNSNNKGKSLFEKETSGAYLYQHFNLLIKSSKIDHNPIKTTQDLDAIAKNGDTPQLAQELFERSAALVACQMAGITLFHKHDLTFVMEGSLFWDGWKYKENVDKYLKLLVPKYKVKFKFIEDSGILGAAKLVA